METIFLIIWASLLTISSIFLLLVSNHNCYCYIFEHKDYKRWEYFLSIADKFKFTYRSEQGIHFEYDNYEAIVWNSGYTSIHLKKHSENENSCILSGFFKKHSLCMTKKLLKTIGV